MSRSIPIAALASFLCFTLAAQARADAPAATPIIGVWYQPSHSFDQWKARGINTLMGYESEGNTVAMPDWKLRARNAGLNYICQPSDDLAADAADPNLIAWLLLPDEPDGAGNKKPEEMLAGYKALKAAAPNKPVLINFDGWQMKWKPESMYAEYLKACDWAAVDVYPFNGGQLQTIDDYTKRIDELNRAGGGGKRLLAFMECGDQNLKAQDWVQTVYLTEKGDLTNTKTDQPVAARMRAPTPAEMKQEIDALVAHGVTGIIYFPDKIGKGWEAFDNTTPELEAAMIKINADLVAPKKK
jgi:hypothetical protein